MSADVQNMFARIAPKYDFLNRVLSAQRDVGWRRDALDLLDGQPADVLDLACGTFDLGLEAIARGKAKRVHGCDFVHNMLVAGGIKRAGHRVSATVGDALHLPYATGAFDAALLAYGWRNFDSPDAALKELRRVIKPGGQLLILEFFKPVDWWPKLFYSTFGRYVIPTVGKLLSGDSTAYTYLNASIWRFMSVEQAEVLFVANGFTVPKRLTCFGGVSHGLAAKRL
jgi:demethylmenaquinone methyltransferase/2-methoxy-6-polyprenyl-1,4-benzoquinol methylase